MHINKPQRAQMINLTVLLQTTARVLSIINLFIIITTIIIRS